MCVVFLTFGQVFRASKTTLTPPLCSTVHAVGMASMAAGDECTEASTGVLTGCNARSRYGHLTFRARHMCIHACIHVLIYVYNMARINTGRKKKLYRENI